MDNYLVTVLIALVFLFIIFLILRELNTWYWKINERVNLHNKEIYLLEQILEELKYISVNDQEPYSHNELEYSASFEDQEEIIEEDQEDENENISEFEFSEMEKELIRQYVTSGLNKNEKIIINKNSRQIKKIDESEWEDINKNGWILINITKKPSP